MPAHSWILACASVLLTATVLWSEVVGLAWHHAHLHDRRLAWSPQWVERVGWEGVCAAGTFWVLGWGIGLILSIVWAATRASCWPTR